MRQFFLRLVLFFIIISVIFGFYRLLTIQPLAPTIFQAAKAGGSVIYVDPGLAVSPAGYTRQAFQVAADAGAGGFFLPLQMSQDGELIVSRLPAPPDGAGGQLSGRSWADLTLAELRALAPDLLTLRDVLQAFPGLPIIAELEAPDDRAAASLLNAIASEGARERVVAFVDDQRLANGLRQLAPDIVTAYTTAEVNAILSTYRLRLTPFYRPAAPVMILSSSLASQGLVQAVHRQGVAVIASAEFQPPQIIQALRASGVDGVITEQLPL